MSYAEEFDKWIQSIRSMNSKEWDKDIKLKSNQMWLIGARDGFQTAWNARQPEVVGPTVEELARALFWMDGWSSPLEDYSETVQEEWINRAQEILDRIKGGNK